MKDKNLKLTPQLVEELTKKMSVNRLAKTGLFRRLDPVYEDLYFYVHLHRSVLDRALVDMFSPYKEIRDEVTDWLDLENDSFIFSCERALLEPTQVYNTFLAVKEVLKDARTTNYHPNSKPE